MLVLVCASIPGPAAGLEGDEAPGGNRPLGKSPHPPSNTTSPSREYSPGVMNDETKLALEQLAKQAKIVERIEGMLAMALEVLRTLMRSAELLGASVQEIARPLGSPITELVGARGGFAAGISLGPGGQSGAGALGPSAARPGPRPVSSHAAPHRAVAGV